MKAELTDQDFISVTFPYNADLVQSVRKLGGYWRPPNWRVPLSLYNVGQLRRLGAHINKELNDWAQSKVAEGMGHRQTYTPAPLPPIKQWAPIKVPTLKLPLMPFQEEGVGFIEANGGKVLLCDEMGLGKTVQTLAWLELSQKLPAVIACPAGLKVNWEREVGKFTNLRPKVFRGKKTPLSVFSDCDVAIINYDIIQHYIPLLNNTVTLALDEAHYIKNPDAKRTKAVLSLAKDLQYIIAMSGTPLTRKPAEFYTALHLIAPDIFPAWRPYAERYCALRHNGFSWVADGATHTDELHQIVNRRIMLRRLKKDVLTQLPSNRRVVVPMELPEGSRYRLAERDFGAWCLEQEAQGKLTMSKMRPQADALKEIAALEKLAPVAEWVADVLNQNNKLILFTTHHAVTDELHRILADYKPLVLDGRVPEAKRQPRIDAFQTMEDRLLFIVSMGAGGTGLNLTAANNVAFVEFGWTWTEHDQAESRAHRHGQTLPVTCYYLVANNTIDETSLKILDSRAKTVQAVLDGKTELEEDAALTTLLQLTK